MPLTNVEKNARHRAKVKLKLARLERYEDALREIAEQNGPAIYHAIVARNALNEEAEASDRHVTPGVYETQHRRVAARGEG